MIGLPVFENEWDFAPAMLLWFFDSRSFVDGHGAGPGVGNRESTLHTVHRSLTSNRGRACRRTEVLGGRDYGPGVHQVSDGPHETRRESQKQWDTQPC